jgi:hypothetical protein
MQKLSLELLLRKLKLFHSNIIIVATRCCHLSQGHGETCLLSKVVPSNSILMVPDPHFNSCQVRQTEDMMFRAPLQPLCIKLSEHMQAAYMLTAGT